MGGWFKKDTVKLDTTIEYIVHEQRWRVTLLLRSKRCITNTHNGTTGPVAQIRRPPPAEHGVHTHVFGRIITVIRYLFGASNQNNSRTMTIPKRTNEMAMVHADGWTPAVSLLL